jgi:hypothetical protein
MAGLADVRAHGLEERQSSLYAEAVLADTGRRRAALGEHLSLVLSAPVVYACVLGTAIGAHGLSGASLDWDSGGGGSDMPYR